MDFTLPRILPAGITGVAEQSPVTLAQAAEAALGSQQSAATDRTSDGKSFGEMLSQALQEINTVHQAADLDASRLASGEDVDLHQVMIGMEKANISFGLALQVRNKLLEAYQEVMRMTV